MSKVTEQRAMHTPGPWAVAAIGMGYSIRGDGNGHCVAFTNTASCSKAALRHDISKDDEEKANAALLAAAPELLESLRELAAGVNKLELATKAQQQAVALPACRALALIGKLLPATESTTHQGDQR